MAFIFKYVTPTVVGIAVSLPILYYIKKLINHKNDEDVLYELMFFCNRGIGCRDHFKNEDTKKLCSIKNCSFLNLSRMLQYINSAKTSLDICIYLITVKDLSAAIINAHRKGIKVRVITDEDMANGSGSQILTFRENGVMVKHQQKSITLMHHKFAIIDEKIVMTGSLNWTMQAICGNWDNLVVTSQRDIVRGFITEFERLWKSF